MPLGPPVTPPAPLRYTMLDIITRASIEAGWRAPGEVPDGDEAQFAFGKLNDMLDEWNAQRPYTFAQQYNVYTLTPDLNPHTIGPADADPSPTFVTSQRPVRLDYAALILNQNGIQVDVEIEVWEKEEWQAESIKDLESQIPIGVYYNATFPAGSLYFWPVPNTAYQVRLGFWIPLTEFSDIQQEFWFPPAYRRALTLSLAEELDGPRSNDPKLAMKAANARAAVRGNNAPSPRVSLDSPGLPQPNARPRFNFLTGKPW